MDGGAAAPRHKKIQSAGNSMTRQRLLIVLTVINLALLVFLLLETRVHIGLGGVRVWTNAQGSVIRGRSLEIIDDEGRVRASITVHPPDPAAAAPSGGTAILRLVDENGRPAVKLSTTQRGGGLALAGESEGTYVQLFGHGLVVTKDGRQQTIP
jgi:hypothetical protein